MAWKRRTGILGSSAISSTMSFLRSAGGKNSTTKASLSWERRWIVVTGTQISYYCLGEEDGTPRGTLDLIANHAQIQVTSIPSSDAPSTHEIDITATSTASALDDPSTTTTSTLSNDIQWKFCFETQQDLMEFLEIVHGILEKGGQFVAKDADRFEHDFVRGDHIYRWGT